jgi:hypothetical protein
MTSVHHHHHHHFQQQQYVLQHHQAVVSDNGVLVPFPEQQLSFDAINPFPESVFSYLMFLISVLVVWVLYILLPRGFRKQYCKASRKRYARRADDRMPAAGYWLPVHSMQRQSTKSMDNSDRNYGPQEREGIPTTINAGNQMGAHTPISPEKRSTSSIMHSTPGSPPRYNDSMTTRRRQSNPPSPEHPALKKIPPNKIIAETMARLQGRGIRLVAHGVHCDPKRVWIRLQDETDKDGTGEPCVTWQTEFPRRVPNQSGQVSIVLMRVRSFGVHSCSSLIS